METSSADPGDDLQHPSAPRDDAGLQPWWADDDDDGIAAAVYGACDVTDSEITANLPPERRAEVEKLAEQVRHRAADAELFDAVAADGFSGKRWQGLSDDMGKYALAVIDAWLNTGYVFAKAAKVGRPMMPTDRERLQLRSDVGLRKQLANGVVGAALVQFRDQALAGTGWRPDGGANLTTYLIGGCVLLFNNEFRLWRGLEKRWRINESTPPEDLVDAENGGVALRRTGLFVAPAQSTVDGDELARALATLKPREKAIVQLYVEKYSYDEIAEITGTTARGVEGVLYRLRHKDIRSRMEGPISNGGATVTDHHDPLTDDDEEFRRLIERSSLGTTGARALRKRTTPERLDAVNAAVDRVWSVRDAVLKWLYIRAMAEDKRHPVLHADDIAKTVDWHDSPLRTSEVEQASSWLLAQGYLKGSESWGHGVGRPMITPKGEALVDAGRSVRGGGEPAQPQGVYISHSTNVAVDSPGAQQSYSVSVQLEKVNAVAAALEDAARAPDASPEAAAEAERMAAEIRAETSRPEPDVGKLNWLLFSAMTGIAATFGQAAGTDLAHLASQALQTF